MNTRRPFTSTFSCWMMTVLAVLVASVFGAGTNANAQTTGYHDFSFGSTISAPTESKPESKLWFNDGVWWGVLFNTSSRAYDIYRLNLTTQAWTDTGTAVDDRPQSIADALWDQASGKLYIVSNLHVSTMQRPIALRRIGGDSIATLTIPVRKATFKMRVSRLP